jgi:hypothetical protein
MSNALVQQASNYLAQLDQLNLGDYFTLFLINDTVNIANTVYRILNGLKQGGKIKEIPFLYGILLIYAFSLGGNTLLSIVQGKPFLVLEFDIFLPLFFIVWTLIAFTPFRLVHILTGFLPVEAVTYALDGFWVGSIMYATIDGAVQDYPGRLISPVVLGTIAGAGGGVVWPILINGLLQKEEDKQFSTHFLNPSYNLIFPFVLSSFYFVSKYLYDHKEISVALGNGTLSIRPELIVKLGAAVWFFWLWVNTRLIPNLQFGKKTDKVVTKAQPATVDAKETKKKR